DEALEMDQLPSSMIIIGGGIIGIEWASMLVDYGVKVTVIEQSETILPEEDELVQKEMQRRLEKRGVLFKTGISLDENQEIGRASSRERGKIQDVSVEEENMKTRQR